MRTIRTTVAGVLWTTAIALGTTGTIWEEAAMRFWSLTLSLIACLVTGQLLVECTVRRERLRIEHLVDGLIASACQAERNDEVAQRRR